MCKKKVTCLGNEMRRWWNDRALVHPAGSSLEWGNRRWLFDWTSWPASSFTPVLFCNYLSVYWYFKMMFCCKLNLCRVLQHAFIGRHVEFKMVEKAQTAVLFSPALSSCFWMYPNLAACSEGVICIQALWCIDLTIQVQYIDYRIWLLIP